LLCINVNVTANLENKKFSKIGLYFLV
jgi:hypothetical protein